MMGRWLKSRLVASTIILGYHRVAEVARDPYGLCVAPQHFAEQLQVLGQYAHPISLRELVEALPDGSLPRRAVVLTFDDGYADALYRVKPLLERHQTPATVFVTTGYAGREFWWDELERVVYTPAALPERLSLPLDGDVYEWVSGEAGKGMSRMGVSSHRLQLLLSIYEQLLPLSSAVREKTLAWLSAWIGAEPGGRPYSRALTANEVVELAAGDLVEIGAHTVTHPVLSKLPSAGQRSEIQGSKMYLESLLGRPVTSFSYANGSSSETTRAIVRGSGFTCACSSHSDVTWHGSDRFQLPRFWIPNWDGSMFTRWLERWSQG
jgi:peptidoglycan/xylan/chitin deacetylase (PgdA/CDA1 family)